jgi:hypothetical protein
MSRVARSTVVPLVLATAVFVAMALSAGKPFGAPSDPTVLIRAGTEFDPAPLLPAGAYVFTGSGFDGQFSFYMAQDPLLLGDDVYRHIDVVSYRHRRILLPALAFVLSGGGDVRALPWVLPAINLVAVLFATWMLARYLRARGRSPWLALLFAGSAGIVLSVLNDVPDALAASLFVVGLLRWSDHRSATAIACFVAACLARETYVVPAAVVAAADILRDRRAARPWLALPVVCGGWLLYVRLHSAWLPDAPVRAVEMPDAFPFSALPGKLSAIARDDVVGAANWEFALIATILVAFGLLAVRALEVVVPAVRGRRLPARSQLIPVVGLASVAVVPFLSDLLWGNPQSYARYVAPLPAILVLLAVRRRDRLALGLAAALVALTVLNPYASVLPTRNGAVIHPLPPR